MNNAKLSYGKVTEIKYPDFSTMIYTFECGAKHRTAIISQDVKIGDLMGYDSHGRMWIMGKAE